MVISRMSCSDEENNETFSTHLSVKSEPVTSSNFNRQLRRSTVWSSEPANLSPSITKAEFDNSKRDSQQFNKNIHLVYGLLEMLSGQDHPDMCQTLLALSKNPESCLVMRHAGCIPLLVDLMQTNKDVEIKNSASKALQNLIKAQPDERVKKRELKVFALLEQLRIYTERLINQSKSVDEKHPVQNIIQLTKFFFNDDHGQTIVKLGGLHILACLIEVEQARHDNTSNNVECILLRSYACMILTNITFGDNTCKAKLCSYRKFTRALVIQLRSENEELKLASASVLRNLSWHADQASKDMLREVGSVAGLTKAAINTSKENVLKSILNALWNLSAHSTENKAEICAIDGAIEFLIKMLSFKSASKSLTVIENAGGILRNISSQIAVRDDYKEILRKQNCLQVLVKHLKASSLTMVNNACGIICNLSSKCSAIQEQLIQMRVEQILHPLANSKHKMIAMNSSAILTCLRNCDGREKNDVIKSHIHPVTTHKETELFRNYQRFVAVNRGALYSSRTHSDTSLQSNRFCGEATRLKHSSGHHSDISLKKGKSFVSYQDPVPLSRNIDCTCKGESSASAEIMDPDPKYVEVKVSPVDFQRKPEDFGVYAETDLDEPTNYSLQYVEDDSEEEICDPVAKANEFIQDTVKTYCTEGTPYQTPFNFSTANSMSDLRSEEALKHNPVGEIENKHQHTKQPVLKSGFSSGLISPEKPINYCEEGTPYCFSRVSSFTSLNTSSGHAKTDGTGQSPNDNAASSSVNNKETTHEPTVKTVKFEEALSYAEETPLMFSRTSSLASLDSIEQHSIHDDRSSIISDFSRLTSGIISPSELPDSPTQTLPPSPKSRKPKFAHATLEAQPKFEQKTEPKPTVFEDKLTKFKEESTPIQFSTATSLSSLNIDDQEEVAADNKKYVESTNINTESPEISNDLSMDKSGEEKCSDTPVVSDEDDDDEDILAACIRMGMRSTRYATNEQNSPSSRLTDCHRDVNSSFVSPSAHCSTEVKRNRVVYINIKDCPSTSSDNKTLTDNLNCEENLDVKTSIENNYLDKRAHPDTRDYIRSEKTSTKHPKDFRRECDIKTRRIDSASSRNDNRPLHVITSEKSTNLRNPNIYSCASDECTSYAVENSPSHFSVRSSLSDLTVDGSVAGAIRQNNVLLTPDVSHAAPPPSPKSHGSANPENNHSEKSQVAVTQEEQQVPVCSNMSEEINDGTPVISEDEDGDDMLAACIKIGMQPNRYRTLEEAKSSTVPSSPSALTFREDCRFSSDNVHVDTHSLNRGVSGKKAKKSTTNKNGIRCQLIKTEEGNLNAEQAVKSEYLLHVAQEKAVLSRQHSASSGLDSIGNIENEQALLEQCILSGMPKRVTSVNERKEERLMTKNLPNIKQEKRRRKRAIVESMRKAVVDLWRFQKN